MRTITLRRSALAAAAVVVVAVVAGCGGDDDDATQTADDTAAPQQETAVFDQEIQSQLIAVGCYSGAEDGIIGPQTDDAIVAFQQAAGLEVDGELGPATENALDEAVAANETVCATSAGTTTAAPSGTTTTAATTTAATTTAATTTAASGAQCTAPPAAHGWRWTPTPSATSRVRRSLWRSSSWAAPARAIDDGPPAALRAQPHRRIQGRSTSDASRRPGSARLRRGRAVPGRCATPACGRDAPAVQRARARRDHQPPG